MLKQSPDYSFFVFPILFLSTCFKLLYHFCLFLTQKNDILLFKSRPGNSDSMEMYC